VSDREAAAAAAPAWTATVVVTGPVDLGTVDALAQLRLTVARLGGRFRVRAVDSRLDDLLHLCGLDDVLADPDR
jgi:hypothetical protein